MRRLFLFAIAFVCIGTAFFFVAPQPQTYAATRTVAATPPCYGQSCYGKDPFTAPFNQCGSSVSHTVTANIVVSGITVGKVTNYYSNFCHANWVEGWLYGGRTGLLIQIADADGSGEHQCYPQSTACEGLYYYGTAFPAWTNMINGIPYTIGTGCYQIDGQCTNGADQ